MSDRDEMNRICDQLFHTRQELDAAKQRLREAEGAYMQASLDFEKFYKPKKPDFRYTPSKSEAPDWR